MLGATLDRASGPSGGAAPMPSCRSSLPPRRSWWSRSRHALLKPAAERFLFLWRIEPDVNLEFRLGPRLVLHLDETVEQLRPAHQARGMEPQRLAASSGRRGPVAEVRMDHA